MSTGRPVPQYIRNAAVDDYRTSGDPMSVVAARHGVSKTALASWIRPRAGKRIRKNYAECDGLGTGHWRPNSRGIQVWQPCPFNSIHRCTINHQENQNAA